MYKKFTFALSIIGAFTLQNCKSTEEDPAPLPIIAPAVTFPDAIKNVDGILAAIVTSTNSNEVGSAHAVFYKSKNPASKLEAGTVTINSKSTTKSDDNIYFYTSSASEPNGLVYGSQINWQVSGNTTNDVPAISDNDGSGFPNMPMVPAFLILLGSQDKPINWSTSNGADSVVLILTGPSATYKRVFNNTVTSHTIPKAEIVKLGIGSGNLQVINYSLKFKNSGTKNYAFLKQCIGICNNVTISQ